MAMQLLMDAVRLSCADAANAAVTAKCNRLQRIMRSVQPLNIEREDYMRVAIAEQA